MKKIDFKKAFTPREGYRVLVPRLLRRSLLLIFISLFSFSAWASAQKLTLNLGNVTLYDALKEIRKEANVEFFYSNDELDVTRKVRANFRDTDVLQAVQSLVGNQYQVKMSEGNVILISPQAPQPKTTSQADRITVKGKITDEKGNALPGVSLQIKGTSTGTATDINGNYSLQAPSDAVLVASFISYNSQEIEIKGRAVLNISMVPSTAQLKDFVVVGYGNTNKKDLTGSISTISAEDIETLAPTTNVEQALQGKAAGVYVVQETGQPGSATRVRVRGATSLLGSNQPLYVIDGIPVAAQSNMPNSGDAFDTGLAQQGLNTPLGNINPADIESINILKDASAAAIYGSRAANGVIIITTKKGTQLGKPQFNVGYSVSTQEAKTTDVLNAAQFREIYTEAVNNSTSTAAFAKAVRDGSYFGTADTDWEKEVSQNNPITHNFNFSATGGNAATRYYTSVGVQDQQGLFDNSSFKRYSLNLNLDTELSKRLLFGTNLNFSGTDQEAPDGSLLSRIYAFRPDLPVIDETGNYSVSPFYNLENPVALSTASTTNQTKLFFGSAFGELELLQGLKLKSALSVNVNNVNTKSFYPSVTLTGGFSRVNGPGDGFGRQGSSDALMHLWENTLSYNKLIAEKHNINSVVGASWQGNRNSFLQASGKGFPKDQILTNLSSASNSFQIASDETQSGLVSYFGRINYGFDDRYLFTVSGRVDGSSKFAEENKWAFFPTAAAAWKISNESFMAGATFVDDLKFRVSAGTTGQQNFGPYQWRTLYEATFYGGRPAVVRSQLGNSRLKWETTDQFDAGVDFSILKGRLSGGIGYYVKNTHDLLYFVETPGNTGISSVIANLGDTRNRGYELELSADIFRYNGFTWNLSANASRNDNTLVRLNDDFLDEETGLINPPNTGSVLKVGLPLGLIYGYVAEGIFQEQSEIDALNQAAPNGVYQNAATSPGDIKFKDISGPDGKPDGIINSFDQTIIGDTQADVFGGFTNTFTFKGISLSALFTYSIGNDLRWDAQRNGINVASTFTSENRTVDILNRWTPENPTDQPRVVYLDPNQNSRISSFYVHDASYLRLRNINLSYTLPKALLSKTKFIRTASVYGIATNIWTLTNYPGADPETNNLFDNDVSAGLDNARFPTPKVFTAGVKLGF
ncbi:SusC/RagA family TonB-linked outer membrane protein [Botryobacter ruber]|uniref:SusC/RagA family TonB-linked outer membrane protein n=1 Tax=Botryobacter ruber TaxID=2171629 RepID=UPI000E0C5D5F|nr:TonB-dependent receptor [Botryobacter ruber]